MHYLTVTTPDVTNFYIRQLGISSTDQGKAMREIKARIAITSDAQVTAKPDMEI